MAKPSEDEQQKLRQVLQQAKRTQHMYEQALERLKKAEAALDTQKAFSDQLLATMQAAVVVLDEHGSIVYINPFLERLSGYRLAEVMEKNWFTTFLPKRDRKRIKALFAKAIGGVQTEANINAIVTRSGEERLIQWYDHLLPAWAGNENWLLASGVDVTDLEQERQMVRHSEHRFRTLIDTLPQGIFLKGPDLRYITCNVAHARSLGLDSPKQVVGRRDEEFFSPELVEKFQTDDRRVMDTGQPIDMEEIGVVGGRMAAVQTVKTPMRNAQGDITGVLGIYWDISERKTDEALLHDAVALAHIGGWAFDVATGEGSWTDETARIHELDPADAVSRDIGLDFFHGESRARIEQALKAAVERGEDYDLELEMVTAKGRQKWVRTIGHAVTREGKVVGLRGAIQDIMERKRAEQELRESEARFRSYIEHSPVAIFVLDGEGQCRDANPAAEALLGYDRQALMGMGFTDVIDADEGRALADFERLREQGHYQGEYRLVRRDGGHIWAMARALRIATDRYLFFCQDITDRKRHEMLLQARLRLVDRAAQADHRQLMQETLDLAEELTDSNIGFFHFVDEDRQEISLQAWSTHTIEHMCTAEGAGMNYEIKKAGVWADAIRNKRPVVYDDYASLPDRQGMPEGHAKVSRIATVPLIRNHKVVAAIGVGNKPWSYDDRDVEALSQLAGLAWNLVEVKKSEEALRLSEETYRSLFDHMLNGLSFCRMAFEDGRPKDFIYLNVNDNFEKLTGLKNVVGRWVSEVIPGIRESNPELFEVYGRVAMGGEPQRFETYVKSLDMWFWLSVYSPKPEHFVVVFDVINERKKAELALAHANRALMTLGTVNRELVHAVDEAELMQAICTAIVEQKGYRMAWVGYVLDDADKDIEIMASAGIPKALLAKIRPDGNEDERGTGPSGRAARTGKTQISQDIAHDPLYQSWRADLLKQGCVADIALPLKGEHDRVFGVLHVYAEEVSAFTDGEIRLLEEMAGDLAFGVRTMRIRRQRDEVMQLDELHMAEIRQNLEETIAAIAKAVEARDPYTAGHQRRVAELAVAIGRRMGLEEEALEGLHMGGTIHDIGKLQVPAEILTKPAKLNAVEYALVKQHPLVGYEILKDIRFPWPVAEIAYQHHERLDGSGYPQGLKGDEICLEARIVAVADVVEAMSSHRPYRGGMGSEAALAEISEHKGTHYDAEAVDACQAVFADGFRFS